MISVIEQYADSVKDKLLKQMLHQRTSVSEHMKEINMKIKDLESMISGVNVVGSKLKQVIDNEQAYLHK